MAPLARLLLLGLLVPFALPASAQLTTSADAGVVSRYLWRGYELSARPAAQGAVGVQYGGLSVSVWGSAALADRPVYGASDEIDVTASYDVSAGAASGTLGLIYYVFPNQGAFRWSDHTSPEVFASTSFDAPLAPTVAVYYDFGLGDGVYASFGIGQDVTVGGQPLALGVTAGYNGGQFGAPAGLSHLDVALSTDVQVGRFSLSPVLTYVQAFAPASVETSRLLFGFFLSR